MRVAESSADLKCRNVRTDVIALAHRSRKLQIQLRCTSMVDLNVVQCVVRLVEGLAEAGRSPLRTKIIRRASRIIFVRNGLRPASARPSTNRTTHWTTFKSTMDVQRS